MLASGRRRLLFLCASFVILSLLAPSNGASNSMENINQSHNKAVHPSEMTPKVSFQLKLHALFHWSSFGFLMPVGIILVRMSTKSQNGRCVRFLFCCHVISQIAAVLLATGGAVLSLMNFENSFSNNHQRVGLALYAFMWLQPIIGFFRPERGVKLRSRWYFFHWILGIAICATGITNVYIGLRIYHDRTTKSVRLWTGLLTVEVSFLAFFYLMIDRWSYMMKQGHLPVQQLRTTDNHRTYPTTLRKELAMVQSEMSKQKDNVGRLAL
ncbi:cytochrome b561 domain-containing protein At2g30890-like [Phragmites australis]|uniref:cytochrome b561 domain-containing protein At2g30890-like n=1 Tax=Phragmites australis TaxID=29695 RepID=UPI002D766299|nr:cytochrome b561 domain-containing protein At2g30890-like [Phragmites australis]